MKKLALILGTVLIGAILVVAGFWLGYSQRFLAGAYSVTAMDRALTEAALRARILHDLDRGDVESARRLLRSGLDSEVVTIWAFGDYSDARTRKMATNVLAGIAAFRAEYPSNYTSRATQDAAEIDARIAEILEQAKKAQTK